MTKGTFSFLTGLLALIAASASAKAAPQVLAVISPPSGTVFACDNGGCRVDLTTYCLQRHRNAPESGQTYRIAEPADFALEVVDAAGVRTRVPAVGNVEFTASRGFMSVSALIRPQTVARFGAVSVTLIASGAAALVPLYGEFDRDPLSAAEIATATGPLRAAGHAMVDESPNVAAALVLADVTRRLPLYEGGDAAQYTAYWRQTEAAMAGRLTHPEGLARARTGFDQCMDSLVAPGHGGVRRCLEWQHDHLIREINKVFWDAQVGS